MSVANPIQGYSIPNIRSIVKGADQTKTSDTTLADDSELVLPVAGNKVYSVRAVIFQKTHATPDFKYDFSLPAGATGIKNTLAPRPDNGDATADITTDVTFATVDASEMIEIVGTVTTGTAAGNIGFRWAQVNSSVEDAIVLAGSSLTLVES